MWLTEAYFEKMLKLIKSVHQRPCLWNVAHENYYNRNLTRQLWSEVEDECDMEPGSAARRWKNMKDTYRKEVRKGIEKSTWLYSKHMSFLQSVIGNTNIRSEMHSAKAENEQSTDEIIYIQTVDNENNAENNTRHENEQENYDCESKQSETESMENTTDNIPKCSELNVNKNCENDDDDDDNSNDDYHFLMSCRQYLKKMTDRKKFQFRMEMQQLMYDFSYSDENQSDDVSVT